MHQQTRDTYNQSADGLSRHYDEIGPRDGDIDLAFTLAGNPRNAEVLELGCGNGRDAESILRYTPNYTGIDASEKMIAIAKSRLPHENFHIADVTKYNFDGQYNLIFAFALLRHLTLEEVTKTLQKAADSLKRGGILYISSMYGESYQSVPYDDNFGAREVYLYNPHIILKHCSPKLKKVEEIYDTVDGTEWFELALRKQT